MERESCKRGCTVWQSAWWRLKPYRVSTDNRKRSRSFFSLHTKLKTVSFCLSKTTFQTWIHSSVKRFLAETSLLLYTPNTPCMRCDSNCHHMFTVQKWTLRTSPSLDITPTRSGSCLCLSLRPALERRPHGFLGNHYFPGRGKRRGRKKMYPKQLYRGNGFSLCPSFVLIASEAQHG